MSNKRVAPPQWREDIDRWLDSLRAAGYSDQTLRTRRYKMTQIAAGVGGSPLDVDGEALVSWMAAQDWKPESRKGYRNTASSFFKWLQRSGRRDDDPSRDIPSVKRPRPHPHPCPDKVILAVLGKATPLETIMLRLGAECGLRRGEIARVHSDDVMDDLLGRSLVVRGKGDKQRIVPLPDDLADEIQAAHGWMFPGRWSGHVEEGYVSKHIARLLGKPWTAHSLRHRYATRTYAQTHDLLLVSQLLGHASVETTQVYVALPDDRMRAALDAVRLVG